MNKSDYRASFYPPAKDYEETETSLENLMRSVYGDVDAEEMADLKAQREERFRVRREKATKDSRTLLRRVNRPVCRRDMITCMDLAIMERVSAYEKNPGTGTAALLVATIICKNMLMDGPLHEGA